jgi:hypothetical protein
VPALKSASGTFWRGACESGSRRMKSVAMPDRLKTFGSMPKVLRPANTIAAESKTYRSKMYELKKNGWGGRTRTCE